MNRALLFSITSLMVLLMGPMATLAFGQVPNCSQELGLPPGFDCEVFVDTDANLSLPFLMDFDSQGNLYISNNQGFAPVTKVAPNGSVTFSSPLPDPDGIAVDSQDNVLVAGNGNITIVNSFNGGADIVLAGGFLNLDAIAVDSNDDLFVLDGESFVKKIFRQTGLVQTILTVSGFTGDLEFNTNDELFIARALPAKLIKIDASSNVDYIVPPSPSLNPGFGAMAFGPGGAFGEVVSSLFKKPI